MESLAAAALCNFIGNTMHTRLSNLVKKRASWCFHQGCIYKVLSLQLHSAYIPCLTERQNKEDSPPLATAA